MSRQIVSLVVWMWRKLRETGLADIAFEWPQRCLGWKILELEPLSNELRYECIFDGCCYGLETTKGQELKKTWRVRTSCQALADVLNLRCKGSKHAICRGKEAEQTGFYCELLVKTIVDALVQHFLGETDVADAEEEEEEKTSQPAASSWEVPLQTSGRVWLPENVDVPPVPCVPTVPRGPK